MAYMTRSRKCESTSHGLHQYANKKITPKGAWIWSSNLVKFEKRKICTWKMQEQIACFFDYK